MTVSNGFRRGLARHGVRRLLAGAACERGAVAYEFAWASVGLFTILIGIVYGGITFYDYVTLANAVTVGAKTIATGRALGTGACGQGQNALTSAAVGLKQTITINEIFTGTGGSSCTVGLAQGDNVIVTATYPCNLYVPVMGTSLCSMKSGTINLPSGAQVVCPSQYTYCIAAIASARIE